MKKVEVKWNRTAKKEITETTPNRIVYECARRLLDMSYITIPKDSGKMRLTSTSRGVFTEGKGYAIGSFTDYAKFVWNLPEKRTHWSTPGTTSKWYARYWERYGESIFKNAVERNNLNDN